MLQGITNRVAGFANKAAQTADVELGAGAAKTFEAILQDNMDAKKVENSKGSASRKVTLENWCRPSDTEEEAQRNLDKLNSMSAEELRNLPEKEFNKLVAKSMTFAQEMLIDARKLVTAESGMASCGMDEKMYSASGMLKLVDHYKEQLRLAGGDEPNFKKLVSLCSSLSEAYKKRGC